MDALISYPLVKPDGWYGPVSNLKHNIDQTRMFDDLNLRINRDGNSLFSVFLMMFLFKGVMVSLAGPAMNSDMQKILSSKSPKEAAKMSGFASLIILPSRFFMIAGFAVLGLIYSEQHYIAGAERIGLEKVLPSIINEFVPAGFLGILIAGLLATFISAFAGTINVAQAYLVNDIYLKYKNPKPSDKKTNHFLWVSGLAIVTISIIAGFFVKNSNSLMIWILSALYGSFVVSNSLKWYWWRFNSKGYIWGMISGIVSAFFIPFVLPGILNIYYFPIILGISAIGSLAGTLMNSPTNPETLKTFYRTVRPWGFWKPVYNLIQTEYPGFKNNNTISRDLINIVLGIIAQTSLLLIPVYVVLMNILPLFIALLIFGVCVFILKMTWWNNLETEKKKYEQHVHYDMNLKQVDLG
jgi:Na+/proline symporter